MTPDEAREPTTEAGRRLLNELGSRFGTVVTSSAIPLILAIEDEARAAVQAELVRVTAVADGAYEAGKLDAEGDYREARAAVLQEVRERVEGLPTGRSWSDREDRMVWLSDVLAALEAPEADRG